MGDQSVRPVPALPREAQRFGRRRPFPPPRQKHHRRTAAPFCAARASRRTWAGNLLLPCSLATSRQCFNPVSGLNNCSCCIPSSATRARRCPWMESWMLYRSAAKSWTVNESNCFSRCEWHDSLALSMGLHLAEQGAVATCQARSCPNPIMPRALR